MRFPRGALPESAGLGAACRRRPRGCTLDGLLVCALLAMRRGVPRATRHRHDAARGSPRAGQVRRRTAPGPRPGRRDVPGLHAPVAHPRHARARPAEEPAAVLPGSHVAGAQSAPDRGDLRRAPTALLGRRRAAAVLWCPRRRSRDGRRGRARPRGVAAPRRGHRRRGAPGPVPELCRGAAIGVERPQGHLGVGGARGLVGTAEVRRGRQAGRPRPLPRPSRLGPARRGQGPGPRHRRRN